MAIYSIDSIFHWPAVFRKPTVTFDWLGWEPWSSTLSTTLVHASLAVSPEICGSPVG